MLLRLLWLLVSGFALLLLLLSCRQLSFVLAHLPVTVSRFLSRHRGCWRGNGFLDGLGFPGLFPRLALRLRLRRNLCLLLFHDCGLLNRLFLRFRLNCHLCRRRFRLCLRLFRRLHVRGLDLWLRSRRGLRLAFWLRNLFWLRLSRFRFRLCFYRGEDGCLDDSLPDWFLFLLFRVFLLLLGGLLQNLVEFDVNFFRSLFQLQVLSELFLNSRKKLVRNLRVRIGLDLNPFAA